MVLLKVKLGPPQVPNIKKFYRVLCGSGPKMGRVKKGIIKNPYICHRAISEANFNFGVQNPNLGILIRVGPLLTRHGLSDPPLIISEYSTLVQYYGFH